MLTRLEIERFRSLRSVRLELEPLTVLVGPNGSGKTALLDALLPDLHVAARAVWRGDPTRDVRRTVVVGHDTVHRATARGGQSLSTGPWTLQRLELRPTELRRQNQLAEEHRLARNGANLANVIATLGRRRTEELSKRLCELIPLFADLDVRPADTGHHRVVFQDRWDEKVWYEPDQVSDGTMLVLAFLTLAFQTEPPDLLTVESPEHSLHPYLLGEVVNLFRKLSRGELGSKATQVVVATHSAELLEFVRPEEVRFVSRDLTTGETIVRAAPVGTDDFKRAWAEYDESLGELWLSGGLGGVPAPVDGA